MKTVGIIAEYNPFHKGHEYHIKESRKLSGSSHVIAVMSGNFVQRGEPAIMLKHQRAASALKGGADLVVELPLPWSMARAQRFAFGAVSVLKRTGCVNALSFGSECGSVQKIEQARKALEDERVTEQTKEYLNSGLPFASSREAAVRDFYFSEADVLRNPNDTLAVEYLNAAERLGAGFEFFAVERQGAGHDREGSGNEFFSASQIREQIKNGKNISSRLPLASAAILANEIKEKNAPSRIERLESAILYSMRKTTPEQLLMCPDVFEGIENRIFEAAQKATSLPMLYDLAKTKRYSHARIRRIVMSAFLGLEEELCRGEPPYIRVLGFNERGREMLREMKKSAELPVVMRAADINGLDDRAKEIFMLESRATDIFVLSLPAIKTCGLEYIANTIRL